MLGTCTTSGDEMAVDILRRNSQSEEFIWTWTSREMDFGPFVGNDCCIGNHIKWSGVDGSVVADRRR